MVKNNKKNKRHKCQCGSSVFENVDITSASSPQKQYFTRCRKCGLVIRGYRSGTIPAVIQLLKRVCERVRFKRSV